MKNFIKFLDQIKNTKEVNEIKGNHRPGWMLRADPALAAKVKEKINAAKLRQKYMGKTSQEIEKMRKEEIEQVEEAKKFGYDAINARFKKKTGQSLEDRAKFYAATSERLKKMQADYEASSKKDSTVKEASSDPRKSGILQKQPDGKFKMVSKVDLLKQRLQAKYKDKPRSTYGER
jgi:hypothetical protein